VDESGAVAEVLLLDDRGLPRSFSSTIGVFETAAIPSGATRETWNVAFAAGSSQHGNARRASVDSNWVAAM